MNEGYNCDSNTYETNPMCYFEDLLDDDQYYKNIRHEDEKY